MRVIPVVVDRSNNSAIHTIAFGAVSFECSIIFSVLGLQVQIGPKPFLCATLRENILEEELPTCMKNVFIITTSGEYAH